MKKKKTKDRQHEQHPDVKVRLLQYCVLLNYIHMRIYTKTARDNCGVQ